MFFEQQHGGTHPSCTAVPENHFNGLQKLVESQDLVGGSRNQPEKQLGFIRGEGEMINMTDVLCISNVGHSHVSVFYKATGPQLEAEFSPPPEAR